MMDFETNRSSNDVGVFLTLDEIDECCSYLQVMKTRRDVYRIHLSEVLGSHLEREITVGFDGRASLI